MNDIYLIRHTTPAVAKGLCYGQTDLGVTDSFAGEAVAIGRVLPADIAVVYSSPLQRCTRLAETLFPGHLLRRRDELMEIHCGEWEMRGWDELPPEEIDPWMADFVNVRIPGGESYVDLHRRVTACWEEVVRQASARGGESRVSAIGPVAVVTHGGVIRSILSGISGVALADSFGRFGLHYSSVVRVSREGGGLVYSVLYNPAPAEREQHKPSGFYGRPAKDGPT
jgi:alpha-ribazole phosphatase